MEFRIACNETEYHSKNFVYLSTLFSLLLVVFFVDIKETVGIQLQLECHNISSWNDWNAWRKVSVFFRLWMRTGAAGGSCVVTSNKRLGQQGGYDRPIWKYHFRGGRPGNDGDTFACQNRWGKKKCLVISSLSLEPIVKRFSISPPIYRRAGQLDTLN